VQRQFGFSGDEVELIVVHVTAAFEAPAGFALIRNKAVETRSQKRLKARFAGVVAGEMVLLERVREEPLRQIFCVFVICVPFEANVFVSGFPVTRKDGVECAAAYELIIAAGAYDRRMIGDRELVKWATNVSIWISHRIYTIFQDSS
jgi:hypothetical protein